jgi:hypothetical protein
MTYGIDSDPENVSLSQMFPTPWATPRPRLKVAVGHARRCLAAITINADLGCIAGLKSERSGWMTATRQFVVINPTHLQRGQPLHAWMRVAARL